MFFIFVFLFFLVHAAPTVYFGDCGDLLSALYTGGIPHSTGFPGYLLLGTLTLSIAKSAFWVNVISVFAASTSCLLLFHLTRTLFSHFEPPETSFWSALGAVLIFLSSSTLMLHGTVARVYTPNLALTLGFMLAGIKGHIGRRWALGLGFLVGLAATFHFLFMAGVVFLIVWYWRKRREIIANGVWMSVGFLLAWSLYLWILLRANLHPTVNWLQSDTLGAFVDYLRQKSYHSLFFARYGAGAWVFFKTLAQIFWNQWPFPWWILALIGGWWFRQKHPRAFAALGAIGLFHLLLSFNYGNEFNMNTAYRYLLPFYAAAAVFAAGGLEWLWGRFVPTSVQQKGLTRTGLCLLLALGLWFPHSLWKGLPQSTASWDYALNLLKPIPKGATFEPIGDNQVFPLAYAVVGNGLRPDLNIVEWSGDFFPQVRQKLAAQPGFTHNQLEEEWFKEGGGQLFIPIDRSMPSPYVVEPFGLVYRISNETIRKSLPDSPDPLAFCRLRNFGVEMEDHEAGETLAEYSLQEAAYKWAIGQKEEALVSAEKASELGGFSVHTLLSLSTIYGKMDEMDKCEMVLKRTIAQEPHSDLAYGNLGILYGKKSQYVQAMEYLTQALRLNPSNTMARYYYQRVRELLAKNAGTLGETVPSGE